MRKLHPVRAALLAAFLLLPLSSGCASTDGANQEGTAEFYNLNAQRFYDGGHYGQALHQFRKALAEAPKNKTALLGQAWSLLFLAESEILGGRAAGGERIQDALAAFEEIENVDFGRNDYKVTLGLGKSHVLLGDLYQARADNLKKELARRPAGDARAAAVVRAEKQAREEYDLAENLFFEVLGEKDNPDARDNLTALIHLARLAVLDERYGDSLLHAERYLEQVRRSKGLWLDAIARFPEDEAIWEARLAWAVAKEIEVRDLIANTYYKLGHLEKAETELDHVILLSPDRPDPYLNRAILRQELGKKREAVGDLRAFLVRAAELEVTEEDTRVLEAARRLISLERELGLPLSDREAEKEKS